MTSKYAECYHSQVGRLGGSYLKHLIYSMLFRCARIVMSGLKRAVTMFLFMLDILLCAEDLTSRLHVGLEIANKEA